MIKKIGLVMVCILSMGMTANVVAFAEEQTEQLEITLEEEQAEEAQINDTEMDPEQEAESDPETEIEEPIEEEMSEITERASENVQEEAKEAPGWKKENGHIYYIGDNGDLLVGWQQIGTWTYYFDPETGVMATGYQVIDGQNFYFKQSGDVGGIKGAMFVGWQKIGSRTFYFREDGANGARGAMLTGWQKIGDKDFYFKQTGANGVKGAMLTGWQKIGNRTFYFKKSGGNGVKGWMFTGFCNINSKTFYFKKTGAYGTKGALLTGWQRIGSKIFYFKKSGGNGVRGWMFTGFCRINGKVFYFKKTSSGAVKGMMFTGRQKIGDKIYYFKENGFYGTIGERCDRWGWLLNKYQNDSSTKQLLFIQYTGGSSAQAVYYTKSGTTWKKVFTESADVGRNGIDKVRQGDKKTPTGTFTLTSGFGIQPNPGAKMNYVQVNPYLYWCGDSAYYNTLVDVRQKPHNCAGEHLIDYKGVYDYGMFLDYNPNCIVGKGSAIFLHCKGSYGYTGGCIGVSRSNMIKILQTAQSGAKICIYPK